MSELKDRARNTANLYGDPQLRGLCDEIERLEAEVERLEDVVLQRNAEIARLHIEKNSEHARVCTDFALLVQESGREGRELDRLEGLLRAWATLEEEWKWNNETHRGTALIKAKDALYAEGLRIAKEKG